VVGQALDKRHVSGTERSDKISRSLRSSIQWRRNEFESGDTGPERKWEPLRAVKIFLVVPLHFLALKAH